MSNIELTQLSKSYGDLQAVDDVSLSIRDGELLCLLGPSGCGKSTTMRMISGLETPTAGSVHIDETEVTTDPAYERNTSMVFQDWALFPYKSVLENVAFGLKMEGVEKTERRELAREMLERVHMSGYEDHDPTDLSGGQKQRVALARSLAVDPDVLLLDEPLSNLDKRLREEMEIELKDIHEEFDKTFVHVTHNQDEAFTLADRIGIMNKGRLVQVGEPTEVYRNPKNKFIESFLGDTNFVEGTVTRVENGITVVSTELDTRIELSLDDVEEGDELTLSLRPEFLSIERQTGHKTKAMADGNGTNTIEGTIETTIYRGSRVRYVVDVAEKTLFVERSVTEDSRLDDGDDVRITCADENILAFDADGDRVSGNR